MPEIPPITIQLNDEAKGLLARLGGDFGQASAPLATALRRAMDKANQLVIREVSKDRFTGRGPFPVAHHRLGVRTNRLRSSLRATKTVSTSDGGLSSAIGSNVIYFGVHEFGFGGSVTVKQHARVRTFGKSGLIRASASPSKKKQITRVGVSTVRAHFREMNTPARMPLRVGIIENLPIYQEKLSEAVIKVLKGAGIT